MPPWYLIIKQLGLAPTFPLLAGSLHEGGLFVDDDEPVDFGAAMLRDMITSPFLDERREWVAMEYCNQREVPVFRVHPRSSIYGKYPTQFPTEGDFVGRLRVRDDILGKREEEFGVFYKWLYRTEKYDHRHAMERGMYSRSGKEWIYHEDCPDFEEALKLLDERDDLTPITA